MKIKLITTAWILGLIAIMAASCKKEDLRPNIVFILADDLARYYDPVDFLLIKK